MLNNKTIAVIGAMDCEVEMLRNLLCETEEVDIGRFCIWKGKIGTNSVIVVKSGVGKVNAAACTQFLADKFSPDYIINTGIAGGVSKGLSVGDVVLATHLVQYDFDVTALGYAKGYMCTGVNPDKPTIFYADESLSSHFEKSAEMVGTTLHRGVIASGDMFVANADKKKEIAEMFNASAVEMEGAAIAQCAYLNNIPFVIVRAISDLADGTAAKSLDDFEYKSAQISSAIIKNLLEK